LVQQASPKKQTIVCFRFHRESHIRPLLERLESDDDRIRIWRDVLATTNGTNEPVSTLERHRGAG
jgi:hypothetical protein